MGVCLFVLIALSRSWGVKGEPRRNGARHLFENPQRAIMTEVRLQALRVMSDSSFVGVGYAHLSALYKLLAACDGLAGVVLKLCAVRLLRSCDLVGNLARLEGEITQVNWRQRSSATEPDHQRNVLRNSNSTAC